MKTSILKKLSISFIILLSGFFAKAQNITVSGKTVNQNGKPLDFVTISLLAVKDSALIKTALTDEEGKYSFSHVVPGNYLISARMFGFKDAYSAAFMVNQQNFNIADIDMTMASKTLNEVTVTAKKPLIERKVDRLVMNVESSTLAIGSTALEVLEKAPGVTVDQNDNIAMQGKQGVNVMMDGKMTYMSNGDLVTMLRNMPSSEIETIELITNPSSKYDASGNAGIINIKRKKGKGLGTNGSTTAGMGYGQNFRGNGGINLNHRSKDVNVFGSYNYNFSNRDQVLNINRITGTNGNATYFSQLANIRNQNKNNSLRTGVDIFLNKKSTLGFLVNSYLSGGDDRNSNQTLVGSSFNKADSSTKVFNTTDKFYRNYSLNTNYKLSLDSLGQEFSFDADYSNFYGKDDNNYDNFFYRADGSNLKSPWFFRNLTPSKIKISALKLDYAKPLSKKSKLEFGLKSSWVKTDNDFQFTQLSNNVWQNDPARSNHFIYDENVNAAYVSFSTEIKKTNIQFGLRAEQTNSKGDLITSNKVVERNYLNFFPTVFLTRSLGKNHSLSLSYSRRIDRPDYDALNPFEFYLDQFTFQRGNPFLNPQLTNSYEMAYTFKQQYNLSFNYSLTNDVITDVLLPDDAKKALYQTKKNLDQQISYGFNLNVPITLTKWWNSSNNVGGFYLGFRSNDLQGQNIKNGKNILQMNSQHNFTLAKTLSAELSGNYTSPMEYGIIKINSQYSVDAGLSKSFLNKKLSAKFAVSDIFNTRKQVIDSAYPGLNYHLTQKNETRIAKISLSYKFGNNDIKPARRRATGLESEQGRLKN
ncbi:MAG: TonB-dependent receptor [Bacteroidetes bacterium]|nr:TonB-dependent receptor [Bacteroidota bacterium]MBU1484510.1 TonB-dependent receptor [Bacteroidota bacterium]MBU2267811.1 TonB-dependent receptor [Bacteroidota bacterium]MBU2375340.1 TonB-dependent receptor [Bacteroidota bacterium]